MKDILKYLGFRIEDYIGDILWLLFLSIFVQDITNFVIGALTKMRYFLQLNGKLEFPLPIEVLWPFVWVVLYLISKWVWSLIVTLISTIFKNNYSFDCEKKNNKINSSRLEREWIFQGNVLPHKGGIIVSNSNSGCLIKPQFLKISKVWKNFIARIEVIFPPQLKDINDKNQFNPYLGIIFRAQDLEDYFMLEFCRKNGELVIRPHIRMGGNWDAPILNPDKNSHTLNTFVDKVIKLKIEVKDKAVKVYVNQNKDPLEWLLPSRVEPNLIQHNNPEFKTRVVISPIYFRNRAGMFGFRNYGNELAWVKSLEIHEI